MKLKNIIRDAEEGGYGPEVPAVPGCAAQGDIIIEELIVNLDVAVEGRLSVDFSS
jgi:predicted RNase H-like HicB family nuclease